jgi:hypothetical protein
MTNPEHQHPHEEAPIMTQEAAGEEPLDIILTEPGEGAHRGHPAVWLSTPSSPDDPLPRGEWVCLGHPSDIVTAAVADATAHGYLPADATVQDMVGLECWQPIAHDSLDIYLKVANGVAKYGSAFAAWTDMVDDPDMFDSFPDFYAGTFNHPSAWAEEEFGDEIEDYLDHTIRADLRPFITADYTALAEYAFQEGRICLYPGNHGELHAFHMDEGPSR